MDQCEDTDLTAPPCKKRPWGEPESHRPEKLHRPDSAGPGPGPSCVSMKSDWSNDRRVDFKGRRPSDRKRVEQLSSEVPSGQSAQQHPTHLDSIFMLLEDNIVTFVKDELKKIQKSLSPDYSGCLESQKEDEEVLMERMKSRGGAAESHF
ncbi:hypothetical protein Q5P01_005983 [Channa striata]|uniref:Uncharacterized protein n=1 Tax=Channa striata TaxID=64152 RepID=A0AA88NDI4_CHASR|nr:hypothetical protein Q5P01_005983 [Channa striata]